MGVCAIFGCSNHTRNKEISFFRFPKDKEICKVWINHCKGKDFINLKNARICSVHFLPEDYERDLKHKLLSDLYKKSVAR